MMNILTETHVGVTCCVIARRLDKINQDFIKYQTRVRLSGTLDYESVEDMYNKAKEARILAETVLNIAPIISESAIKKDVTEMAEYHIKTAVSLIDAYNQSHGEALN